MVTMQSKKDMMSAKKVVLEKTLDPYFTPKKMIFLNSKNNSTY